MLLVALVAALEEFDEGYRFVHSLEGIADALIEKAP